jgi:hypothetical protein
MTTVKRDIVFHGIHTQAVNYKGVQIIRNSMIDNGWMLFFSKDGKYPNESPFAGTLSQMKVIINDAIRIGKGGEKQLIQADTYK